MGALTTVEEYDRALALADVVEAAARSQGAVSNVLLAEGVRGDVAGRRGDLAGAEEIMRSLAETSQSIGWVLGLITALWWMGDVILERAANDDLADLLDAFEVPPGFEAVAPGAWALVVRGRVRALRGRRDEAAEDLRAAGAVFDGLGFGAMHDPWRSDLALVLPASEREEAQALVAEELRQAEATGFARPHAVALRASGLLTGGDARHRAAGGVGDAVGRVARALSPCPRAGRPRCGAASQWPCDRCARVAAGGDGARVCVWCRPPARAGARRAARRRRPSASGRPLRIRRADRQRAPDRPARHGGPLEPRDRAGAVSSA